MGSSIGGIVEVIGGQSGSCLSAATTQGSKVIFSHSTALCPTCPSNKSPETGSKLNRHGLRIPTAQNSVRMRFVSRIGYPLNELTPT